MRFCSRRAFHSAGVLMLLALLSPTTMPSLAAHVPESRGLRLQASANVAAPDDTVIVTAAWPASCDSLGCADAYEVAWTVAHQSALARGTSELPLRETITSDTADQARVTMSATGLASTVCVTVTARRGGEPSLSRTACRAIATRPVPPPPVDSIVLDTLPPVVVRDPAPEPDEPPVTPDPADTSAVRPFFVDGFETGDTARTTALFSWGHMNKTRIDSTYARTGKYSMRFRYPGSAPDGDAMAEQRFRIEGEPRELWAEWWVRVPDNWTMRTGGPTNNKLVALWANTYSSSSGVQVVQEMHRRGDTAANVASIITRSEGEKLELAPVFTLADRGRWVRLRHHWKIASGDSAHDGVVEVWRDAAHVAQYVGPLWRPGGFNFWKHGYLLGWANTGFAEDTHFYVDDVAWYNRDPQWRGSVADTATAAITSSSSYALTDGATHTFAHRRDVGEDVFIAHSALGATSAANFYPRYAGVLATKVAGVSLAGVSSALFWYRIPAAALDTIAGVHDVTLTSSRGAHVHAISVRNVGSVTLTHDRSETAPTDFVLPSLGEANRDVVVGAFAHQHPLVVRGEVLARTVTDSATPARGRPERGLTTVRGRTLSLVPADSVPVAGLALRITGVRRHP